MTLNELNVGGQGIVVKIKEKMHMKQRLIDIGIIPGTKLECVLESPRKRPQGIYD